MIRMNEFIFQNTSGTYHKFDRVYEDLNIDTVIDKVDRTVTKFGRDKLKHRLTCTVSDPTDLQKILDLNQMVSIDDTYRDQMRKSLIKVKKIEKDVVRWMKSKPDQIDHGLEENKGKSDKSDKHEDGNSKNPDSDLYFQKGTVYNPYNLMNNRYTLTASNRFVMTSVLIIIIVYVIIYLYLTYIGLPLSIADYMHGIYQGYVLFCRFLLMQIMSNVDWIEMGAIILAVTYVGYQIYNSYKSVMICYEHYCLCSDFIDRYEKMCEFVEVASEIFESDRYVRNLYEDDEKKLKDAIEYLRGYFEKGNSLGYSLVSQISTYDYIGHMNTLVNYIGKIDMQCGICALIREGYYLIGGRNMESVDRIEELRAKFTSNRPDSSKRCDSDRTEQGG